MEFFESLAKVLPRLKTVIQLFGVVVAVAGFVATKTAAPEQVHAQISAGAIGVLIIVFGQVFHFLERIPEKQRAKLVLWLFLITVVFILLLVTVTGYFLLTVPKTSVIPPRLTRHHANWNEGDNAYTVYLRWDARPDEMLYWELLPGDSRDPDALDFELERSHPLEKDRDFKDVSVPAKDMPTSPHGRIVVVTLDGRAFPGRARPLETKVERSSP